MRKKLAYNIAGATVSLVMLTILSKAIGFAREIIFAGKFGLSVEYDLFLVSSIIPITINSAAIYIAQHYFIPAYNKIDPQNQNEQKEFFNNSLYFFFIVSLVISIFLLLFSKQVLQVYFQGQQQELKDLARITFLLFLLTIPFNAGISIFSAYLQSNFRFILPAASQILMNVLIIILVIFFGSSLTKLILPISYFVSYMTAFGLLLYALRKQIIPKFSIGHLKKIKVLDVNFIFYLVFIELLSLSYSLIDRSFYGDINQGGIAALSYAMNIYSIPISIFSIALITTIFTKFSKSAVSNTNELITDFNKSLGLNLYLMIPITAVFMLMGDSFIRIFYERGRFTSSDTLLTFEALRNYSLSLIFYSSYLIIVKLLYSLSRYRIIFIGSIIAFGLKIIFNIILVERFHQNGMALSTSIVYFFLFSFSVIYCLLRLRVIGNFNFFKQLLFYSVNALLSYFVIIELGEVIPVLTMIPCIVKVILFIVLYIVNSYLCDDVNIKTIFNVLREYSSVNKLKALIQ